MLKLGRLTGSLEEPGIVIVDVFVAIVYGTV